MGLAEIMAPIGEALKEECRFVGPDRTDDNSAPPRISWQPVSARLLLPQGARGEGPTDPIFTRQWAVVVETWAKDIEKAEALQDRFLAEAFRVLSKNSISAGSQPLEEDWNPGGVTAKGSVCRLVLFIQRPVLRTPPRLASPATIVTKTGVDGSAEQITVNVVPET